MTGHDRLLDEIVKLSRRVAESERRNAALAQTIAAQADTLARREARIESLERQFWDLAVHP